MVHYTFAVPVNNNQMWSVFRIYRTAHWTSNSRSNFRQWQFLNRTSLGFMYEQKLIGLFHQRESSQQRIYSRIVALHPSSELHIYKSILLERHSTICVWIAVERKESDWFRSQIAVFLMMSRIISWELWKPSRCYSISEPIFTRVIAHSSFYTRLHAHIENAFWCVFSFFICMCLCTNAILDVARRFSF